jgi:hypothetical protein
MLSKKAFLILYKSIGGIDRMKQQRGMWKKVKGEIVNGKID